MKQRFYAWIGIIALVMANPYVAYAAYSGPTAAPTGNNTPGAVWLSPPSQQTGSTNISGDSAIGNNFIMTSGKAITVPANAGSSALYISNYGTSPTGFTANIVGDLTISGGLAATPGILRVPQICLNGDCKTAWPSGGGGGTIGGSGNVGYIPFFSGATTIANSYIYQSGMNIGINTTSPISALTVNGTISATYGLYANRYNSGGIAIKGTRNYFAAYDVLGATDAPTSDSWHRVLTMPSQDSNYEADIVGTMTNNQARLFYQSKEAGFSSGWKEFILANQSGIVGIGTTSPAGNRQLNVFTPSGPGMTAIYGNGSSIGGDFYGSNVGVTAAGQSTGVTGTGGASGAGGTGVNGSGGTWGGTFGNLTAPTNQVYIASQTVGVDSTGINTGVRAIGTSATWGEGLYASGPWAAIEAQSSGYGVFARSSGGEAISAIGASYGISAGGSTAGVYGHGGPIGVLADGTYSLYGSSGVLYNNGNVGIRATSPAAALHIHDISNQLNTYAGKDIILSRFWNSSSDSRASSIAHYFDSTDGQDKLMFGVSGNGGAFTDPRYPANAKLVVRADGYTGLGTFYPAYKLDIQGDSIQNWVRSRGATGWYNETYGGGWFMQDASWLRTYNEKNVWTGNGLLGSNGGLTVGWGGATPPSTGAMIAGYVGIGTSNVPLPLAVAATAGSVYNQIWQQSNNWNCGYAAAAYTDGNFYINRWCGGASASAYLTPAGAWVQYSDKDLKKDIKSLTYGIDDVMKLKPVTYVRKDDENGGTKLIGFIAQDVKAVIPELVSGKAISEGGTGLGLNYQNMTAVLTSAIQDQQKEIEELKAKNSDLEKRLEAIEAKLK